LSRVDIAARGVKEEIMPRPYTQLILVNVLLAVLFSTTVLGAPTFPSIFGAVAAGALLHARRTKRERALGSTDRSAAVTASAFPALARRPKDARQPTRMVSEPQIVSRVSADSRSTTNR
jgi:hypothetical protein